MEKVVILRNKTGLHARPATKFVQLSQTFTSDIQVEKNGKCVDAKSIINLMALGVGPNEKFTIRAHGQDEELAIDKLDELIGQLALEQE